MKGALNKAVNRTDQKGDCLHSHGLYRVHRPCVHPDFGPRGGLMPPVHRLQPTTALRKTIRQSQFQTHFKRRTFQLGSALPQIKPVLIPALLTVRTGKIAGSGPPDKLPTGQAVYLDHCFIDISISYSAFLFHQHHPPSMKSSTAPGRVGTKPVKPARDPAKQVKQRITAGLPAGTP